MSLPLVHLPLARQRVVGIPDPAEKVDTTIASHSGTYGRRTLAHIQWTIEQLAIQFPGARLVIIQGCYHSGYTPSAGTHDGDGVIDAEIIGLSWDKAQTFLRQCGWAAWWRHTGSWAARSAWHIHMVSLGCPGAIGYYVPAQVDDYYNHAEGLAGEHASGDDPTWHPANIDATYFDYPAWLITQEDKMPWNDWPLDDRKQAAADIATACAEAVWGYTVGATKLTAEKVLNRVFGLVPGGAKKGGSK